MPHIHLHLGGHRSADTGTSEGAKKAAQTRAQHRPAKPPKRAYNRSPQYLAEKARGESERKAFMEHLGSHTSGILGSGATRVNTFSGKGGKF